VYLKLYTPKGTIKGGPGLVAFFKSVEPLARGNRHLTLNVIITDEAPAGVAPRARVSACRLLHRASNPPALLATGVIQDEVERRGGEWLFVSRRFVMDPPAEAAAA